MAQVAGTIKAVTGLVGIMKPGGPMYGAKVGDVVEENDVVKTLDPNSSIVLELEGGREIVLGGDEEVLVDKSVFAAVDEGTTVDMATLQAALQAEGKPGEMEATASGKEGATPDDMEATAAGEEGPGDPALVDVPYTERGDARGDVEVSLRPTEFGAAGVEPSAEQLYDMPHDASVSSETRDIYETDEPLSTQGSLVISDLDFGESQAQPQTNIHGSYGTFSVDADGNWNYVADSAYNELNAGDIISDTFTVTSVDGSGSGTVTINIIGTNDAATVSSETRNLSETNAPLSTDGTLTITDVDEGEAQVVAQTNVAGTYGTFSIDADGKWEYTANSAYDELNAGDKISDSFTVTSVDGTGSGTVTVTITGTNDAATVSSASVQLDETNAPLSTDGTLTITDVDEGEAQVVAQTNVAGTYGTFSIDADGKWEYTANSAYDELNAGDKISDSFTVTSVDGTGSGTVTVTIIGTNDLATVSSATASVTEDAAPLVLQTGGTLIITDADDEEAYAQPQTNTAGDYGTFSVDANGNWIYQADNTQDAIQQLGVGEKLIETFTVTSLDGTGEGKVTVTIWGTNDVPILANDSGTSDAIRYTSTWDYSLNAGNDYTNEHVTLNAIGGTSVDGSGPTMGVDGYEQNDSGQMLDAASDITPAEGIEFVFDAQVKQVYVDFGNFNVHDTATWEVYDSVTDQVIASGVYTNSGNPNDSFIDLEFGTAFDTVRIINSDESNSFSIDEVLVSNHGTESFIEATPLYFEEASLLSNDFDPDASDTLNIIGVDDSSSLGSVSMDSDGNILYDPTGIDFEAYYEQHDAYPDSDTFTYTASDGHGGVESATVTVDFNYAESGGGYNGEVLLVDDYMMSGQQSIDFNNIAAMADNVTRIDLKDGDEGKFLDNMTTDNVSDLLGDDYSVLHIDGESVDSIELNGFTHDQVLSDAASGYDAYTGSSSGGDEVIVYIDTDITDVNVIP